MTTRTLMRSWLLLFLCFLFTLSHAQNIDWMLGTWNGSDNVLGKHKSIKTLVIDAVFGENFTGTKTIELKEGNHAKVVTSIAGYVSKDQIYLRNIALLYKKDPPHGEFVDCSSCTPQIKIAIQQDSVMIIVRISGCQQNCDGVSFYYRYLCDYDSITQRYLVGLFGTPSDVANFKPCTKKPPEIIASDPDKVKPNEDSLRNAVAVAKKRQQEIDDSVALAKKQQKRVDKSLAIVAAVAKQKEQQRIQDSLTNVAALARKRQKEIDDSTKNAVALAKKRQQQIDDSIALAKKLQKQFNDSLAAVAVIAGQKEQQRIQDSLTNAAVLAKKRQKGIDDSTKNAIALAKRRQQQIDDSIALVKKRQKQVVDSLAGVAAVAVIARQKEQQRIQDSLTNAAAVAKKRQQQINDSINLAKQKEQLRVQDSINNATAKANKLPVTGKDGVSASTTKAFATRDNVLLQTYHITTPDILVELFDNAEIDGDRVSVYHNNSLIVNNQMLLREPITFKIHADAADRTHEFILIAENLGTIPPNTALMRITVGTQIYKLSVKTDLKTNAKIMFYYDGN